MNISIKRKSPIVKSSFWDKWAVVFCCLILFFPITLLLIFGIFPRVSDEVEQILPQPVEVSLHAVDTIELVVTSVADSYGVPAGAMLRFAEYLEDNQFNEQYGGVGLFLVKPDHVGWIRDSVLFDTDIDLYNNYQNTQIAAFLIRQFYDAGYSWGEAFMIYTWGFPAIHNMVLRESFLEVIFPDGE